MLYNTTRSQTDVYTAHKAIHTDCAPDGGLYVPFRLPVYGRYDIQALAERSFGQNVAEILNAFFSAGLTGWDVEFALGRSPVKLDGINHRVVIAECWHNPERQLSYAIRVLSDMLRKEGKMELPNNWVEIAVCIACLFAVYGEFLRADSRAADSPVDIAVTTGDFMMPMAAWYAREMGLPIGNIVCGCNANGGVWDLLHRGEFSTGATQMKTTTPEADVVVPRNLERLICATLGVPETVKYLEKCTRGGIYGPAAEDFEKLRKGMFAAVISDSRVKSLIHSVQRTSKYIFGPYSVLAYGSLMDYRAKTGESRTALLICDKSPMCDAEFVARSLDVTLEQLLLKQG